MFGEQMHVTLTARSLGFNFDLRYDWRKGSPKLAPRLKGAQRTVSLDVGENGRPIMQAGTSPWAK